MIEHQVHHDAGNRDVHPERQRPARNSAMALKILSLRPPHGNDYKRDNDGGEKSVRPQDRKVNWPRNSLPCKSRHPVMLMVNKIRDQKQDRGGQSQQLTITVRDDFLTAYEDVPTSKEQEAGGVEGRIKMREHRVEIAHGCCIRKKNFKSTAQADLPS